MMLKLNFFKYFKKNNIDCYLSAKRWIETNTINISLDREAIRISHDKDVAYPEVSGYYIPTLIRFGQIERARKYANYLICIQNANGSFMEPRGEIEYTFDTGQILKGLYAIIVAGGGDYKYKNAFLKGCDYIVSQQRSDGSIATSYYGAWKLPYGKECPESVHLYALEPLREATKRFKIPKYEECVKKALNFYLKDSKLTDFNTLSHFNAYVIEALIDLGEIQRAQSAMDKIAKYQKDDGSIPAYSNVSFTCSTGLFQYAICWYKLGGEANISKANKAFSYALSLQNASGGWFGSYGRKANYFKKSEISWAVKYFLDALYYKQKVEFENLSDSFLGSIDKNDGRYKELESLAKGAQKILDVGCGKGRYERNLFETYPEKEYFGVDFSGKVLKFTPEFMQTKEGSLLCIPYEDESFDLVFSSEALEHAIDIEVAIKELVRVMAKGGKILIIDKNISKLGKLKIAEWEQWFNANQVKDIMQNMGLKVEIKENIPYENKQDGLFVGWIGRKSE